MVLEFESEKPHERLKEVMEQLEHGIMGVFDSDRYKEYLRVMSKFHNYSFNNTMLILMQMPGATRLAGFQTWKKMGRYVRKGEKGIKIIAPAPYKKNVKVGRVDSLTMQPILGADGKQLTTEKEIVVPYFKMVSTYDISQTEGNPLPDIAPDELVGDVQDYENLFAALEKISPFPISFEDFSREAYGFCDYQQGRIVIRPGLSELQTVKTTIHEIAHAKMHEAHNPVLEDEPPKVDRRTREVQAESVAFAVASHFSLDTSEYTFPYVAAWSSGRERKELRSSLETIRDTAADIIDKVDQQLLEMRQEEEISGPVMAM